MELAAQSQQRTEEYLDPPVCVLFGCSKLGILWSGSASEACTCSAFVGIGPNIHPQIWPTGLKVSLPAAHLQIHSTLC